MNNLIFLSLYNLSHQSASFDSLVVFLAKYFPYLVIFLAIIFLLYHHEIFSKKKPAEEILQKLKEILFVSGSVIFAWLVSIFLKIIFLEPRPFMILSGILPMFWPNDFSFPSGHSAFFMALAIAIFLYHKKMGYLFILFALLIGLARIIAGVHFPLDILGGYLVGGFISYLLIKSFSK